MRLLIIMIIAMALFPIPFVVNAQSELRIMEDRLIAPTVVSQNSQQPKLLAPGTLKLGEPPALPSPISPPPLSQPTPKVPSTGVPEKGVINPRTGEFYPGTFGGVLNPQTGALLPKVDGGYVNPQTGEFLPAK
jgi:hypothetical protein